MHLRVSTSLMNREIGKKSAKDLTALFLAGPNPMNDLRVLTELGVAVRNIWAIESDPDAYKMAVESVLMDGSPLKLYHGSLHQFFYIHLALGAPLDGDRPPAPANTAPA